jgi:hypothetical protein
VADQLVASSPEWWRRRLILRLRARNELSDEYAAFYEGVQPLAFASAKFAQTFGQRYARLPANFMPLVVDAEAERLIVQGFRFGGSSADKGVWSIWQANQLDEESQIAHEIALVKGVSYALVAPGSPPVVTIEDPAEVVVETEPGNRRLRRAALKLFLDDEGHLRSFLYLPESIYKWRSVREWRATYSMENVQWEPFADEGESFPVRNALGVVPVIPLLNRPRRDGSGRSEIAPVMGNQNAINKLRFDSLVAAEYVAFPQRWVTNIDIPVDPDTGKPIAPFKPGVENLWAIRRPTPDEVASYGDKVPPPALGQFPAADLGPYIEAIEAEIGEMSAISRTPYHYFLGTPTAVPPSGESIKSSEATLVKKVGRASVNLGEGWEETMRVALIAAGQTSKARVVDAETIWADPETRNEAARTDSIIKQYQVGLLPREVALEKLGYSQTEIDRIVKLREAQDAEEDEQAAEDAEDALAAVGRLSPNGVGAALTNGDARA